MSQMPICSQVTVYTQVTVCSYFIEEGCIESLVTSDYIRTSNYVRTSDYLYLPYRGGLSGVTSHE